MTEPRWYCVDNLGVALLCSSKEDAERESDEWNAIDITTGPHRAVQPVDAAELEPLAKAIGSEKVVLPEAVFEDLNDLGRRVHEVLVYPGAQVVHCPVCNGSWTKDCKPEVRSLECGLAKPNGPRCPHCGEVVRLILL